MVYQVCSSENYTELTFSDAKTGKVALLTLVDEGAGKSTLSKTILGRLPSFVRISIDARIHDTHGLYGIDYPSEKYSDYQIEAKEFVIGELRRLLHQRKRDIVLDLAFCNAQYRNEFKEMIEASGGRWVLVFLDASRDTLWKRITMRKELRDSLSTADKGRDGDSAFDIDEETFEMYWSGFERPEGEGEIIIKVD